jgi:hypothetical protein
LLSRGDYGAVRGFIDGRGDHRWSCGRAQLRLQPTFAGPACAVTLEMGSPPPSPIADPVVSVRVPGAPALTVRLSPEVRPYTFPARLERGEPLVVELRAPTWNSVGEPPEQGVRVDRMTVAPAASVSRARLAGVRRGPESE